MSYRYIKELKILVSRSDDYATLMDAVQKGLKSGKLHSLNVDQKIQSMSGSTEVYEITIGYFSTPETETAVASIVLFDGDIEVAKGYNFL